ncbi:MULTISPECIES: hypothetical protein [Burkholderia]|uniref:hypothetical protein n=1 Tax=Burkholderia TaxID=32008 RepID=UPI00158F50A5|nr:MULTISPECIES: hypothetical protein [Burkholderia]MBR8208676.1 hypothetical protein [Burkholderia cenocepacia]MCA8235685.1 hypothetical protein [Burkholderia cenocepacia]
MTTIYDTIVWLQSDTSAEQFPIVEFSADTDMATMGWVSLTSTDQPEIVVTQVTAEEFRAIADGTDGYLAVEHRVNAALERFDLKCSWLVRVDDGSNVAGGSFQMFREAYRPPKLFFRDIFHSDSLAQEASRTTRAEFERNGGKVIVLQ